LWGIKVSDGFLVFFCLVKFILYIGVEIMFGLQKLTPSEARILEDFRSIGKGGGKEEGRGLVKRLVKAMGGRGKDADDDVGLELLSHAADMLGGKAEGKVLRNALRAIIRRLSTLEADKARESLSYLGEVLPLVYGTNISGVPLRLSVTNRFELGRLSLLEKETWTAEWVNSTLDGSSVLYDVGANIGVVSLYACLRHPGLKAFCFEPSFSSYAGLMTNIRVNGLVGMMRALPIAVGEGDELISFNLARLDAGAALHSIGGEVVGKGGEAVMIQDVLCRSLDSLVGDLGLPVPTHLKIDVDGHESAVLAGGKTILANPTLKGMLIEVNGDQKIREVPLIEYLDGFGFKVRSESGREGAGVRYFELVRG
jgi:FkbM family methyltransferase